MGPGGPLAVVVWLPPPGIPVRFALLHVPAAGDELNKSRRMVALQARELARCGGMIALVDLRGTGDSAGEHGDATWNGWHADVEAAWDWLGTVGGPVPRVLWGLRLGGLLAADLVASRRIAPAALLLWQPVVSGRQFFGQWLRMATTQQLTTSGQSTDDAKSLRRMLEKGSTVEVGGYELGPELVLRADAVDLATVRAPACRVLWRETTVASPAAISPAATRVEAAWKRDGVTADFNAVKGPSFWASQELSEAPALVRATTDALVEQIANVAEIR